MKVSGLHFAEGRQIIDSIYLEFAQRQMHASLLLRNVPPTNAPNLKARHTSFMQVIDP